MSAALERRLRRMRSRVLVRSWDYRQRRHARGVWFRLRRLLAHASAALSVPPETAQRLLDEGFRPEAVGRELEPPKLMFVVPAARAARLESARPLAVRLSAELLAAECLVLVPFEPEARAPES